MHWRQLPAQMRAEIRKHYVLGQEKLGITSPGYMIAAHRAILWTCKRERPEDYLQLKKKYHYIDRVLLEKIHEEEKITSTESTTSSTQLDAVSS
jgi:hypothetical protein